MFSRIASDSLTTRSMPENRFVRVKYTQGRPCEFCVSWSDYKRKLAGYKLYGAILLVLYRRHREEVKQLNKIIQELKVVHDKSVNKIHKFHTWQNIETKRSENLTSKLRILTKELHSQKSLHEELHTKNSVFQREILVLQRNLENKIKEINDLKSVYQTKLTEMERYKFESRGLRKLVFEQQNNINSLKAEREDFLSKIDQNQSEVRNIEEQYRHALEEKEANFASKLEHITELNADLVGLNRGDNLSNNKERAMKLEIWLLKQEIQRLNHELENTLFNALKKCWQHLLYMPIKTFQFACRVLYFLLPAFPIIS